jgi:Bacteriophage capsid protein
MTSEIMPVTTLKGRNEKQVYDYYVRDIFSDVFNGDKFNGSFGPTKLYQFVDYWTLRKRSLQLFKENPYAIGVIRRIMRNEIHSGITAEAAPIAEVIWPDMDPEEREKKAVALAEEMTLNFNLYSNDYNVFDYKKQLTFGEFQEQVRREALLCGDGIIVARINQQTKLPYWDWINGNYIRTPEDFIPAPGNVIKHGVEIDNCGRHVAYHIQYWDGTELQYERIPVFGPKSGRQISWMIYGQERMLEDVRGTPILACMLYMLKELDRYRDAEERAAVVNAMLPLFIKRTNANNPGTRPTGGLARLHGGAPGTPPGTSVEAGGAAVPPPTQPMVGMEPGTVFDDLAPGEEPISFNTNRPNVNYKAFEEAIINVFCWTLEIPPEIARLMFTSSYSAGRQANNEFDVYLKYRTYKNAKDFCQLIYQETIIQLCLTGQLDLPGFIDVIFDPAEWKKRNAWLNCSWTGISRPSVDLLKDVDAAKAAINLGISTYDIQTRKISGMSFRSVQQKLAREREIMAKLGFVPSTDEDQNGKPAYTDIEERVETIEQQLDGFLHHREGDKK